MPPQAEPTLADVERFVAEVSTLRHDVYVGIDPGVSGAIALLCGPKFVVVDIPVIELARTRRVTLKKKDQLPGGPKSKQVHGKTSVFDRSAICALFKALRPLRGRVAVALEVAKPMVKGKGGNNVRTAYLVGVGYGIWPLFLIAQGYPLEEFEPADWKKAWGLWGKDKKASLLKARNLWPSAPLGRARDHGRAEALLLAEHCRRLRGNQLPP